MKTEYIVAEIEVIDLLKADIITTSAGDNDFNFGEIIETDSTNTTSEKSWDQGW